MNHCRSTFRRGLTLVELAIVIAILVILAGLLVSRFSIVQDSAVTATTKTNLATVRDAIAGKPDQAGFYTDTDYLPGKVADLFVNPFLSTDPLYKFNPNTGKGWNGPYILNSSGTYAVVPAAGFTSAYGANGDGAVVDGWGRPIVLQRPTVGTVADQDLYTRLISAGPNGIIDTPPDATTIDAGNVLRPYPSPAVRGDDIVIFVLRADTSP